MQSARTAATANAAAENRLRQDLENLRAAVGDAGPDEVFVPAVAPSGVGGNEYYPAEAVYLAAVADALRVEYLAVINAGFTLQIDDPFLSEVFSYSTAPLAEKLTAWEQSVAATNRALRGIPRDRVRLHTCYGINEGLRVFDAPLGDLIDILFTVQAGALSFEAGNLRHEYNYHAFESVKLPDDMVLLPGVISHATNIVEYPGTIADRIVRSPGGSAGRTSSPADCGFSSQATYHPEIHLKIIWAKFEALAEGARRATARLWRPERSGSVTWVSHRPTGPSSTCADPRPGRRLQPPTSDRADRTAVSLIRGQADCGAEGA